MGEAAPEGYPAPPWTLEGHGLFLPALLSADRLSRLLPPALSIFSPLPGQTPGGLYFARYGPGSMLSYSELILFAGVARFKLHFGGWVSHIYVDSPASIAGGRAIWGLPKRPGEFEEDAACVRVRSGSAILCELHWKRQLGEIPASAPLPCFGMNESGLLHFTASARARVSLAEIRLSVPDDSPLREVLRSRRGAGFWLESLSIRVPAPRVLVRPDSPPEN